MSWGGKFWGPPKRMWLWLPAAGTGGPVSPALGTAAFCCPLVRYGSWAPFGVPMVPTPPFWGPSGRGTAFGVPRAGHTPAGWWHFMLGAAVPGWLLHVPLRDESPTLKLIDPPKAAVLVSPFPRPRGTPLCLPAMRWVAGCCHRGVSPGHPFPLGLALCQAVRRHLL